MSFSGFEYIMLDEVITFYNGKKKPSTKGDIPVYGGNGVLDYCGEFNAKDECIIIGRVGAYCGNVRYENEPCWISDNAILAKSKLNSYSKFMYYNLKFLNLNNNRIGSSQPLITQSTLKKIKTMLPPLQEQKAIADILSSLDEKIELNNQMNKTLEEMAQSIFKRWFVDFNFPDGDGEPYKDSGGKMVESELGMIPEGWEVKALGEIGEVVAGGTPSTKIEEYYDGEISWITPRDLSGYNRKFIKRGERSITEIGLKKSSAKIMPPNSVLFSSRAPIGYITIAENELCTNQGFKSIVCNSNVVTHNYIYHVLKNEKDKIESIATGSTFKEVSATTVKGYKILVPEIKQVKVFSEVIERFDQEMKKNYNEIDILEETRDTLLPKLMSGEIRVSDIQNEI